jgi:hypothetical protein
MRQRREKQTHFRYADTVPIGALARKGGQALARTDLSNSRSTDKGESA